MSELVTYNALTNQFSSASGKESVYYEIADDSILDFKESRLGFGILGQVIINPPILIHASGIIKKAKTFPPVPPVYIFEDEGGTIPLNLADLIKNQVEKGAQITDKLKQVLNI